MIEFLFGPPVAEGPAFRRVVEETLDRTCRFTENVSQRWGEAVEFHVMTAKK